MSSAVSNASYTYINQLSPNVTADTDLSKWVHMPCIECVYIPSLDIYATLEPSDYCDYWLHLDQLYSKDSGHLQRLVPGSEIVHFRVVKTPIYHGYNITKRLNF